MNQILLLAGIVIILSVFLHKLSTKIGMPALLAFLLLGMLFGVDGIFKIHFENFALSEALCSFGLIFIMFSGGFETSWKEARYVAKEAILLSSFGVVLTSFLLLKGRREKRGMKVFQGEDLFFFQFPVRTCFKAAVQCDGTHLYPF